MKRILLLEFCFLFLATTFRGDSPPPGWYIQSIPVNKNITDIYFIDTLNGWAVTGNTGQLDSGYIIKTTNGGASWLLNYSNDRNLFAIQFADINTGYACGGWGPGKFYKTTNGGNNWSQIYTNGTIFNDLYFLNKDTGWVCDDGLTPFGAGLLKTTNGGLNWFQQMNNSYRPKKLFFLNKDTGWVMSDGGGIYRTNNSGNSWSLMYNFGSTVNLSDMFFTTSDTGWVIESQFVYKTTNGGLNWQTQIIPNYTYPMFIFMNTSNYGYLSTGLQNILKTVNGYQWRKQNAPAGGYDELFFTDSLHGWVNHGNLGVNDIAATVDGGGPVLGVKQISSEAPDGFKLEQNYPNPFNQLTIINYQLSIRADIKIVIFDISGKEISIPINQSQTPGTYEYDFDAGSLSSGVYFYTLFADGRRIDTRKMILLK
jgi:hypothetical protein